MTFLLKLREPHGKHTLYSLGSYHSVHDIINHIYPIFLSVRENRTHAAMLTGPNTCPLVTQQNVLIFLSPRLTFVELDTSTCICSPYLFWWKPDFSLWQSRVLILYLAPCSMHIKMCCVTHMRVHEKTNMHRYKQNLSHAKALCWLFLKPGLGMWLVWLCSQQPDLLSRSWHSF